jgi:hypothetical protein
MDCWLRCHVVPHARQRPFPSDEVFDDQRVSPETSGNAEYPNSPRECVPSPQSLCASGRKDWQFWSEIRAAFSLRSRPNSALSPPLPKRRLTSLKTPRLASAVGTGVWEHLFDRRLFGARRCPELSIDPPLAARPAPQDTGRFLFRGGRRSGRPMSSNRHRFGDRSGHDPYAAPAKWVAFLDVSSG